MPTKQRGRAASTARIPRSRPSRLPSPALALLLAVPLWSGCGGSEPAAGGGPGGAGAGDGRGRRPNLPAVAVAVAPAETGEIASYYTTTATLEPNKQADVLSRVSGVVLQIRAEEGDRVARDQDLLLIQDDEHQARLKEAEAQLARQRSRFARSQKLFEQNLVSAEEFETVKNDLLAAEASRELAALELSYTAVKSPFAGRVVRRHVDPGQSVSMGTPLYTIADLSRLLARVHVPAKEFRSIQIDQPVELRIDSDGGGLAGRITLVSPVIDPTSGTIKVTVEIEDYPQETRPGDFAEVRIVTDRHTDAVLVPRTSILTDKGERVVYVAIDSVATRRVVEVGYQSDAATEIVNGLRSGELIVVQGQRSLEDGQPLRILERMTLDPEEGARAAEF